MRHACGDKENVSCLDVVHFTIDNQNTGPSRNKIELVPVMYTLVVGTTRGKKHKRHAASFKRFDIPDPIEPLIVGSERELFEKLVYCELHFG